METLVAGELFAERYQIEAALGRGAMGAVYRARDLALGEVVALKILDVGDAPPPVAVLRFRQEAKLARRVTHRNVARVFDIGEHEGALFLTMELVLGDTLRALLMSGEKMPLTRAARIGLELCAGLAAAHAAGVVHRDLKPANVLVEAATGRVVIADFGIARALEEEAGLTVGAIGTPAYMPPEQRAVGRLDQRADLYALGVVLAELITRRRPSAAEPFAPDGVPLALAALVQRALSSDPAMRPGSAEEMAAVLVPFASAHPDLSKPTSAIFAAPVGIVDLAAVATVAHAMKGPEATPTHSVPRSITGVPARAIAVLPLRYRGPVERQDLADSLTDELVDVLSRIKSLRVFGASATQRFKGDRDARAVCRELGVLAVVDGAVQVAPASAGGAERLRLTARLLDADGAQLYSEQFNGGVEDALTMHERLAHRVAEQLRLELTLLTHRGEAPEEAIELYLRARRRMAALQLEGPDGALATLERAILLAPTFGPARSHYAISSVRAWFFAVLADDQRDRQAEAVARVEAALAIAPDEPDTHLAAAMLAVQLGDFATAGAELDFSLRIAPTHAMALEYLGQLEMEAGYIEVGRARLHLAIDLNATSLLGHWTLARHAAFERAWDTYEAILDDVGSRESRGHSPHQILRARVAAWRGDRQALGEIASEPFTDKREINVFAAIYARAVLGMVTPAELDATAEGLPNTASLRFQCAREQLLCEAHALGGDIARASRCLERATDGVLIDVAWLKLCPALEPLRGTTVFENAMRKASERARLLRRAAL